MYTLFKKKSSEKKGPNFFIVGAPKCGTTALSEYLRSHPEVFMCTPKEPSFFCQDLPGLQYTSKIDDYERLFSKSSSLHTAIGEASPSYLLSKVAIKHIHEYNPQSKIIVMLRNPADMLHSYHNQLVFSMFENELDFHKAWDLQEARREQKNIPTSCREPQLLQYEDVANFGDQLERLYSIFPRDQILIISFDDFKANTQNEYLRTLEFLGLQPNDKKNFPAINPRKTAKYNTINRLLHNPPGWAHKLMTKIAGSKPHEFLVKMHEKIKSYNMGEADQVRMDDKFRAQLLELYRPQINQVEKLTQLDLGIWKI